VPRPAPPCGQQDVRIVLHSQHESCTYGVLDQVPNLHRVVFIAAKRMVVISVLPYWRFKAHLDETLGAVALQCVHDGRQRALAQLSGEVQMIGHYHCRVDGKSICSMQPANRVEHYRGVRVDGKDWTPAYD